MPNDGSPERRPFEPVEGDLAAVQAFDPVAFAKRLEAARAQREQALARRREAADGSGAERAPEPTPPARFAVEPPPRPAFTPAPRARSSSEAVRAPRPAPPEPLVAPPRRTAPRRDDGARRVAGLAALLLVLGAGAALTLAPDLRRDMFDLAAGAAGARRIAEVFAIEDAPPAVRTEAAGLPAGSPAAPRPDPVASAVPAPGLPERVVLAARPLPTLPGLDTPTPPAAPAAPAAPPPPAPTLAPTLSAAGAPPAPDAAPPPGPAGPSPSPPPAVYPKLVAPPAPAAPSDDAPIPARDLLAPPAREAPAAAQIATRTPRATERPAAAVVASVAVHAPASLSDTALAATIAAVGAAGFDAFGVRVGMQIGRTHVRFFHASDASAARRLAAAIAIGGAAEIRDFTHFSPRPAPGRLEAWLSGAPRASASPAPALTPAALPRAAVPPAGAGRAAGRAEPAVRAGPAVVVGRPPSAAPAPPRRTPLLRRLLGRAGLEPRDSTSSRAAPPDGPSVSIDPERLQGLVRAAGSPIVAPQE